MFAILFYLNKNEYFVDILVVIIDKTNLIVILCCLFIAVIIDVRRIVAPQEDHLVTRDIRDQDHVRMSIVIMI